MEYFIAAMAFIAPIFTFALGIKTGERREHIKCVGQVARLQSQLAMMKWERDHQI